MEISAALVKKLRDDTDAPVMECKRALQKAADELGNGPVEEKLLARSKEILREAGKVAAGKRAGRTVGHGTVALACSDDGKTSAAVLLQCETDFVSANDDFRAMAQRFAGFFLDEEPGENPETQTLDGRPISGHIEDAVLKMRENIQLGGAKRVSTGGVIGNYLHHDKSKAALVALECESVDEAVQDLAKQLAMQVVAFAPDYINRDQVESDRVSKEKELQKQRAIKEGKPADIAEKIAEGRVNKEFFQQVVLLDQAWFADQKKKARDVVEETAKAAGCEIRVTRIVRLGAGQPGVDSSV